jgi:nitronate monooxygenase
MSWHSSLGLRWPIVQAPMAGVQGSRLAAAVFQAGGLGSLPAAMLTPDALRTELTQLRDDGVTTYNLNFFCHAAREADPAQHAAWCAALAPTAKRMGVPMADVLSARGASREPFGAAALACVEDFKPRVVSFHFGLPSAPLLTRVKATGAQVWSSATTVDEALWLQAHGCDVIIAQGWEAGGHRGMFLSDDLSQQLSTMALLPMVVDAVKLPVVAAGGIADARGVAAAMALGASGVQVGTAFLLAPEATTSAVHRAALQSPQAVHTALTNVYTGRPARGIVNGLMRDLGCLNADAPDFPHAGAAVSVLRARAEAQGQGDCSPLWSGQAGCRLGAQTAAQTLAALSLGLA